jgi:outer membrane PBP1 activator LpoA protein
MKTLLVVLTSMILFACTADEPDERTETIGKEIADNYNETLDKAKDVERQLQEQKEAIDKALREAEQAGDP